MQFLRPRHVQFHKAMHVHVDVCVLRHRDLLCRRRRLPNVSFRPV
jgi:hypothetical protein